MQENIRILDEIQKKREKMIEAANRNGMTNDDTIRASQELDKLIYEYQCHNKKTTIPSGEFRMAIKQMMLIPQQAQFLS